MPAPPPLPLFFISLCLSPRLSHKFSLLSLPCSLTQSFLFLNLFFPLLAFLTCFSVTLESLLHAPALAISLLPLSPILISLVLTSCCIVYFTLLRVLCDTERSESSNAWPLMGDYRYRALIPFSHTNIKPVEMSVHTPVCVFVYIRECDQRLKVTPHNLIIKKKHTKTITHTHTEKKIICQWHRRKPAA